MLTVNTSSLFKRPRADAGDESLDVQRERVPIRHHQHLAHRRLERQGFRCVALQRALSKICSKAYAIPRHLLPRDLCIPHLGMQPVSRNVGHASVRNVKHVQGRLRLCLLHNPVLAL
jgi:hypothetical protein